MKINALLYLFLILFSIPFAVNSQVIRGTVTDSITGETLIAATVVQIDKTNRFVNGTITDLNGNYTIKVDQEHVTLGFSYIGYDFKKVEADVNTELNIQLKPSDSQLGEVVVTAGRINSGDGMSNVPIRDLATSVASIEMKQLESTPASSVAEALQGRISGVDIGFNSGDPGAGMSIKIRGTTSLNGNSRPLIILDGVPYETSIGTDFNFSSADVADYGSLVDISPADIKQIQILKDAAATAVWGSKAANGVIVINTKRGVVKKTQFNFDYRYSYVLEPEPLPMLSGDQYVRLILDEKFNRNPIGLSTIPTEYLNDPTYPLYYNYNKNTDWVRAVTQNGFTNDVNFSVAGGGDKARYRASLGYYNQLGTTIGTNLTRITTRLNLDYDISDKLKLSTGFSYTNSDRDRNYFDGDWGNRNRQVRSMAYRKAPHMSVYEYDEDGILTGNYFSPLQSQQGTGLSYLNPVALAKDGIFNDRKDRILTNFQLKYQILKGLDYYANVAFDIANNHNTKLFPQSATGVEIGNSQLNKVQSKEDIQNIIQTYNKLIYKPELGQKHDLMLLGMFSTYDKYATQLNIVSAGMPSYFLSDPTNIGIQNGASSYRARVRTLSYLINTNYVYNDRYIIGGGVRVDGDSRFGTNNRYGYFPSLSAAWRMSAEKFMSSFKKLTDLKLRVSYGVNGYSTGSSYQYLSKYASSSGYMGNNGINLANIELNNLRWETTNQMNYGVDASFFDFRFTITFDYYNKITKDIIFNNLAIPSSTGFSSVTSNFGTLSNKGWELNFNARILELSKLKVGAEFNFARNVNIIESLPENYSNERFSVSNSYYARRIIVGDPMGAFYGFRYLGVFSEPQDAVAHDSNGNVILDPVTEKPLPYLINGQTARAGDAHYEDINFDGNINELDIVYLGNANPDFFGGFGLNIRYDKLSFSAYFNYKIGQDVINETRMYNENMYTTDNQSTAVLRRWRANGDVTDIPRALYGQGLNWLGSDRFVEKASFLRMKSLSANYLISDDWIKGMGIKSLKAFVTAYNIFTMTNYTGQDPEVGYNVSNNLFELGKDRSMTPPPVSFTMGLSMTF